MQSILNLTKTNKLVLAAVAFLAVMAFGSGRAHAATLNVSGGCTLPIAINSVNAGANQSGCTATGSYGTSDTITIPAGTITLTADLPTISEDVMIQGAGMSQTTINGDNGQYEALDINASQASVSGIKLTAYEGCAIAFTETNAVLDDVEIDGANSTKRNPGNSFCGVEVLAGSGTFTFDSDNLYIHNINAAGRVYIEGILVNPSGGSTINVELQNTTFSDIHALSGGVNGIFMGAGFLQTGGGNITANIVNTTVDDVTSTAITAPFANIAFADGGDANVTTVVNNITITGTRGAPGSGFLSGLNTAAFYAIGVGAGASDNGTVNVSIGNSLMADNLLDTTPSNCFAGDLTPNYGGSGTVVTNITSLGHNIADDNSCGFTQTGDKHDIGNIISTLGALGDNGGAVPTRALLAGSPAISAGGAVLGVTTDARGVARPDDCPSVGAFQFEGAVCGASTPSTPGSGDAGAPNTGIGAVSPAMTIIATSLGLGIIAYALRKRNAVK